MLGRAFVPGDVLAGKYRVERILGEGGMGFVLGVRNIALDEPVAIKVLKPEMTRDACGAKSPFSCAREATVTRS
jgi:serine/threonine protein kinase